VTQQLIDDTRLTPENVMLDGVKTTLANGGDIVGWRGCFGESLVSTHLLLSHLIDTFNVGISINYSSALDCPFHLFCKNYQLTFC